MSLADRPYGQGLRLICNGEIDFVRGVALVGCGRQFNPRRPRPADERELRRRAELHGWTSKALAPGYRFDFCPDHKAPSTKKGKGP